MRFQNKVVIVTGGGSGIGAAIALSFAKEGANVVIIGRGENKLKKIEELSEKDGNKVFVVQGDVSKEEDAKRLIQETIDNFGKLDVLVNNAGIGGKGSILDGKLFEHFDAVMNTNLRSVVHLTTLAAPHLIATKGNIINISSVHGKSVLGTSIFMAYLTSKAALDHFSRAAALELGPKGVRVNILSPGPVVTDIIKKGGLDVDIADMAPMTALNRVSQPEEVAKLVMFLASDDAVGITGADFTLDNGYVINLGAATATENFDR